MHVRSCLYNAELFFAVVDAVAWSLLKALFTLYQIALRRRENRTGQCFCSYTRLTISAQFLWRGEATPRQSRTLWRVICRIGSGPYTFSDSRGSEYVVARTATHWDEINIQEWDLGLSSPSWLSANRSGTMFDVCELLVQAQGSCCFCYTYI